MSSFTDYPIQVDLFIKLTNHKESKTFLFKGGTEKLLSEFLLKFK